MPKPDAEQFARVILWHLAGLRADVCQLQDQVAELKGEQPVASRTLRKKLNKQMHDTLFSEALRECGLFKEPPGGF
jgi:hypothetical protein